MDEEVTDDQRGSRHPSDPARHFASNSDDPALPPMGMRIGLKASADLGGLGKQARIVARATALRRPARRQRLAVVLQRRA